MKLLNYNPILLKHFIAILFTFYYFGIKESFAQKVYKVKYESQANIKIYIVKYESQCDLKVFLVKYESQIKNDGLWFPVKFESQADIKIYFVKFESQADLKIFIVEYKSQAGWKKKDKMYLLEFHK